MCPSTATDDDRDRLNIRGFYLRLSCADARRPLPETLTLLYSPSIDGRAPAPALATLRRVRSAGPGAVFASAERVSTGDGARFAAYAGEVKVAEGLFRRGGGGARWTVEWRSSAAAAEVWAVEERGSGRRMRGRGLGLGLGLCSKLEEIPEEESDGCDCCGCGGEEEGDGWEVVVGGGSDGGKWGEGMDGGDAAAATETVRWAVDVGIWVACLGVGLLVSRAPLWRWKKLIRLSLLSLC